jgi:hypothetical protein
MRGTGKVCTTKRAVGGCEKVCILGVAQGVTREYKELIQPASELDFVLGGRKSKLTRQNRGAL